ncbi:apolipoprotein N-acyltransferase [Accumulibacter sp.]|uniref:apolipoprotein N-acyltransferase n=1 Tax=Accumulibacter sp. TaxID=2053492 RepID=UPI0026205DF7|nr:apolipoprotein N-acyltransferase [Accumulibacter sp.]
MMRFQQATWRRACAFLLGLAGVLAFAPCGWFPLNWLTLAGLFGLLCAEAEGERRMRNGAWLTTAFSCGLFLAGVSWVFVSLSVFGGLPMPLAGLATVLFCAVLALVSAPVGALFIRLAPDGRLRRGLLFAGLWTLAEWTRGWLLTGFPWLAAGYSQVPPSPLAGYAPLVGVFGVSLASALGAALIYEVGRRWLTVDHCSTRAVLRWCPALPLLGLAALFGGGEYLSAVRWTEPVGDKLSVALLQGNVAQEMKWRPERLVESLQTYYRLAEENPARLTVMPETALPAFLEQIPLAYLEALRELALRQNGDVLFGIAVADGRRYANSALSLGTAGEQRYDKVHLVPFGEFVPPGFAWFMALVDIPLADFTRGARRQPPLLLAGQRVGVNICYEDAFGEEIIDALPTATLLVNLSNVAWFGDSLAPAQHLQIAQMRALETGRVMLRATNTGMTAIVNPDGRLQAVLPPFTRAALVGEVQPYAGATPFVRWGNWPIVVLAAVFVALAAGRRRLP